MHQERSCYPTRLSERRRHVHKLRVSQVGPNGDEHREHHLCLCLAGIYLRERQLQTTFKECYYLEETASAHDCDFRDWLDNLHCSWQSQRRRSSRQLLLQLFQVPLDRELHQTYLHHHPYKKLTFFLEEIRPCHLRVAAHGFVHHRLHRLLLLDGIPLLWRVCGRSLIIRHFQRLILLDVHLNHNF